MSKKRRTPNNEGRGNVNPNPTPENTGDQQESKGGLKEKAMAAGSKAVGAAKSLGGKIWKHRGKLGLVFGAATVALIKFVSKHDSDQLEEEFGECPDEIEQPEPDEETPDTEAADE